MRTTVMAAAAAAAVITLSGCDASPNRPKVTWSTGTLQQVDSEAASCADGQTIGEDDALLPDWAAGQATLADAQLAADGDVVELTVRADTAWTADYDLGDAEETVTRNWSVQLVSADVPSRRVLVIGGDNRDGDQPYFARVITQPADPSGGIPNRPADALHIDGDTTVVQFDRDQLPFDGPVEFVARSSAQVVAGDRAGTAAEDDLCPMTEGNLRWHLTDGSGGFTLLSTGPLPPDRARAPLPADVSRTPPVPTPPPAPPTPSTPTAAPAPTAPSAPSPGDVGEVVVDDRSPPGELTDHGAALLRAWLADDRDAAGQVAEPEVVNTLWDGLPPLRDLNLHLACFASASAGSRCEFETGDSAFGGQLYPVQDPRWPRFGTAETWSNIDR